MSNGSNERRSYDPLDRATFEAIAYSAVGRASEIGTYPALSLTHSSGNSGWSVGIVQWDFGQPGRGEKVGELFAGYQAWAASDAQFTEQEVKGLSSRLRTRGQIGNALMSEEKERLNEYLRSDPGRAFVDSLNQEQVNRKWENVGEPLSGIEWLRDLRTADPAQATEIVAQVMKLYNQNEVRGSRLIAHLQDNESSAAQTREWIGTDGIHGLIPNARAAIVSGRDNAIAGARLMSALEQGEGRLSQAWRREVHENGNPSLLMNFNADPDVQLLDAMMRNPGAGVVLLSYVESGDRARHIVVRGINQDAAREMSRVELAPEGELTVTSPNGDEFQMVREGWNRNGVPMRARQPGRAADQLDHTEGVWRLGALTPADEQHPDHAMLHQIRGGVRRLDEQVGRSYDETSERISRCLLASCKEYTPIPARIDHVVIGRNSEHIFAVEGELDDPAHVRVKVPVVEAARTPVDQSDQRLETANREIEQQRALALQLETQREMESPTRRGPVMV